MIVFILENIYQVEYKQTLLNSILFCFQFYFPEKSILMFADVCRLFANIENESLFLYHKKNEHTGTRK